MYIESSILLYNVFGGTNIRASIEDIVNSNPESKRKKALDRAKKILIKKLASEQNWKTKAQNGLKKKGLSDKQKKDKQDAIDRRNSNIEYIKKLQKV